MTDTVTNEDFAYQEAEHDSVLMLFKHIRDTLFIDPQVVRLAHLTDKLVEFERTHGCCAVKQQTKIHIRRELEADSELLSISSVQQT